MKGTVHSYSNVIIFAYGEGMRCRGKLSLPPVSYLSFPNCETRTEQGIPAFDELRPMELKHGEKDAEYEPMHLP